MAGTNPRDPAFSQILYCVPVDAAVEATGAVAPGILSGQTAMAAGLTPAQGVSALSRHFIPVNAGLTEEAFTDAAEDSDANPSPRRGNGVDYGNAADNRAAQREECEQMIGDRVPIGGGAAVEIGWTVFGNQ